MHSSPQNRQHIGYKVRLRMSDGAVDSIAATSGGGTIYGRRDVIQRRRQHS